MQLVAFHMLRLHGAGLDGRLSRLYTTQPVVYNPLYNRLYSGLFRVNRS